MENSFIKNFVILFMGTGINIIIGVLTTPIITRLVDPTEYGQLSFFNMYSSIAFVVLIMGLDQAYVRFFYREDTIEYKRLILFNVIKFPLILTLIVSIVIFFIGGNFLESKGNENLLLIIFCLNLITLVLNRISILTVRLQLKTKLLASLTILQKILYVCVVLILILYFDSNHFLMLIFATFFSQFITTIVAIWRERKIWTLDYHTQYKSFNTTELLKYSYPFIFSSIVGWVFQAADKLTIKYFGTFEDVGIFAGAINIIALFTIIQSTFNTIWAPMSMEHYEKHPEEKQFYIIGNQAITVVMFFLGINLILFKDIFALFLGKNYREVAYIIPFLIFNPIMTTVSETTVNGINFVKKSYLHIVITSGACIFNILGNCILVPVYGIRGAAISTGVAYIVFFTIRTLLANKYYYIDFKLKRFYFLTFLTALYALYNTFFAFGILTVAGYITICLVMMLLYKDIIKYGLNLIKTKGLIFFVK